MPLRRHLRRGAVALLLFEVPGNIFHCGDSVKFIFDRVISVAESSANVSLLPCCGSALLPGAKDGGK